MKEENEREMLERFKRVMEAQTEAYTNHALQLAEVNKNLRELIESNKKIENHFTNGFKKELKNHQEEVLKTCFVEIKEEVKRSTTNMVLKLSGAITLILTALTLIYAYIDKHNFNQVVEEVIKQIK